MKTILVTGGAGYIGSHACKALAAAGFKPVSFDNLVYGHREAVRWGPLCVGDLLNPQEIASVLKEYQPVAVMHFAAYAYVGESVENPGKYYRNNVVGSLNLLEAMRDAGIDKFIFSSSCATYGLPQAIPMAETHVQNPVNPYGASKLMIERMLKDFEHAHGLRSICLRYFNAAGADADLDIGEDHTPETHLIPLVLEAAAGKRDSISMYGNDYATPDGSCIRDYVHVSDIADAHVLALQALIKGATGAVYNLGNGRGHSVLEVIATAGVVTGKDIPVKISSRREGDPDCLVGDATLIKNELGWSPRYSALSDIIGSAWRWHRKQVAREQS
jgi:UDP-arabinose 4-epimerase